MSRTSIFANGMIEQFIERVRSMSEDDWSRVPGVDRSPLLWQRAVMGTLVGIQFSLTKGQSSIEDLAERAACDVLWEELADRDRPFLARLRVAQALEGLRIWQRSPETGARIYERSIGHVIPLSTLI